MTHRDHITALLRTKVGRSTGSRSGRARAAAEEHVARCSDCWAIVSLFHELSTGSPPADRGRMTVLFGCERVQEELHLLADLTVAEMRAGHSEATRHLAWCFACRDRFAEVWLVEQAARRGEFDVPALPALPRAAAWRTLTTETAEALLEATGRLVVGVRRTVAGFTLVPTGFELAPIPVAVRGEAAPVLPSGPALGRAVRFTLGESDLVADLTLQPEGKDRVGLTVRLSGGEPTRRSLHVRAVHPDQETLVARHTMRGVEPVVVRGLRPGHYVLEIEEKQPARRFRVRLDVDSVT